MRKSFSSILGPATALAVVILIGGWAILYPHYPENTWAATDQLLSHMGNAHDWQVTHVQPTITNHQTYTLIANPYFDADKALFISKSRYGELYVSVRIPGRIYALKDGVCVKEMSDAPCADLAPNRWKDIYDASIDFARRNGAEI